MTDVSGRGTAPGGVAVIVLNHNGQRHLGPCLASVLALQQLPGPGAVVVADNASSDGSLAFVRDTFPDVRVLPFDSNVGFAGGMNRAVAAVTTDRLLLLNNDTAVAPDALVHLSAAIDAGAACAGARLVDWTGRRLDFDGGGASFSGHGHPLGHGRPVPGRAPGGADTRLTLFASGAAMLVRRRVFVDVGGFDPDYFMYYEDVDLGWRLWLAGHSVVHVPMAVVRHRGGGSAEHVGPVTARRLHERNAVATVARCYGDALLNRVLPAALALAAVRAGAPAAVIDGARPSGGETGTGAIQFGPDATRIGPAAVEIGRAAIQAGPAAIDDRPVDPAGPDAGAAAPALPLPPADWAGWTALAVLGLDFDRLAVGRQRVQATRRRPDAEVLPLLGTPLAPVPASRAMRAAVGHAAASFGLDAVFEPGGRAQPAAGRPAAGVPGLVGRARATLQSGGWPALADEVRRYIAWRRGGG